MLELFTAVALAAAPLEAVSFDQAVQRALTSHPALRVADQDVVRADALTEQVRSSSLPSLGVGALYTRLVADRLLGDRVIAGKDQFAGTVTLTVPVVNTAQWARWWRAAQSADAVRAGAADVRRQVAVGAARAWLSVLGQQRVVEAAERARDTAQVHLDYARDRRVGGVGNRLDELRAAQELAVSRGQLETAYGQLVRLQEALGVAVGADAPLNAAAVEPDLGAPASVDDALGGADERLDVKAAKARAEVARSATRADWTDYLPLLSAVFQPFTQNPPSLIQPQWGWQGNLVLTIPLYEGGLRYGQAHERVAVARSSDAQLEAALRQAKSEVRTAFEGVKHADLALAAARDSATQAADALELATVAWKAGATTNLEVIDAERRARDAQTQAAVAEDAARQARLDLLAASGKFP